MNFVIAGEGLTDYIVLKNLLIGFFNNKNLPVNRLLPKDKEPVGWGNVLKYLSTEEFRNGVINSDYCIVQIDTNECEDWNEELIHIGDDESKVNVFIRDIIKVLINRIGQEYVNLKNKIILQYLCIILNAGYFHLTLLNLLNKRKLLVVKMQ